MIHSIIGEMDIFYSDAGYSGIYPQLCQRRCKSGIVTLIRQEDGLKPYSFFSTDPNDYINKNKKAFSADS